MYLPLGSRDAGGDLAAVDAVVHQEHLDLGHVADEHLLEAVRQDVARLVVLLVADLGHLLSTLEAAASGAIDTTHDSVGVRVDSLPLVGLEPSRRPGDLLHNFSPVQWLHGHFE